MTGPDKKTILVVDDDDGVRSLVRAVLRRHGHSVDTARDGAEALQKIRDDAYSLILLDLMMPKVDGFQFLQTLRDDPEHAAVPIIVVSAHLQSDPAQVLALGASTLLPKPFDIDELTDLIECLL